MNRNLSDGLNLLSKLTPRRTINAAKVVSSYYLSKWINKPIHWGLPISISIEPTTSCNLRCPECPSGIRSFSRNTGMLGEDIFEKTINELHEYITYLILYFQGEPYLNPRFFDYVKFAAHKKIYTATSTNGHFLSPENAEKTVQSGLDRLIISIDGTTQETYEKYRKGGNLEKVLHGAKEIVAAKKRLKSKTPHLIFQMVVFSTNENQIKDLYLLAEQVGVNEVAIKTAQIYDYENGNPLIPINEKWSRYKKGPNGRYHIKNELLNQCWRMWNSCVLTWDGHVVPCCFDKDASHRMGNIAEKSFETIWKSNEYKNFRTAILSSRSQIEICRNCSEGTKVWEREI